MQTKHRNNDSRMKRKGFLLFTIIVLLATTRLYAQQQGGAQNNLLPEIDPQDIEIRSEFTARFPGLHRQPILGFNPEPSVYQVDPNRKPFMESQEEVVANLPITDLSRPAAPPYKPLHYSPQINAFGRLGVGSFLSPEAEFWGIKNFSQKSYLDGRLDYHSSDGHLDTENSSFRFFDADAEYAFKVNRNTSFKLRGGLKNSFNRLYELNLNAPTIQVPDGPRKEYKGYHAGIALNHYKNSVAGWDADAGIRWYDLSMNAGDLGGGATESAFNASFNKEWAGNHLQETFAIKASAKGGSYDISSQSSTESWLTTRAGGEYRRLLNYSTQITAGAGLVYTSNPDENKLYPGFSFKIKRWIQGDLTITGTLTGQPKLHTIEQLNQLNRFLNYQPELRHTYNVEGAGELNLRFLEGSSIYARVSYTQAQNYAYFHRTSHGTGSQNGYYTVEYGDAHKLKGAAGVTYQLIPEKLWINGQAYVQQPRFDSGGDVPYEENWGVNSGLSAKILQRFRIQGWANYVSKRNTLSSTTLDGFLLVGGQLNIDITNRIGVYAKLKNLLSQDYEIWDGYRERPFQAYGGVTVKLD